MKIVASILCMALIVSSCKENEKAAEIAPLLKSDTTFVVKPELPVQEPEANNEKAAEEEKPQKTVKKSSARATQSKSNVAPTTAAKSETASTGGAGSDNAAASQPAAEEAPEKKGWSKTAKGAVIGGVVGAGTGAVVNKKNRVAGAVIGGVLGAGAGAVIGNEMDKKDGRH